ncbi:hypothetical protein A2853_03680 [Candidatus Kaiserbacteria bacterium RIFCSPHIGHO2_01_FULL_55_17]|uniref:Putative pterin-4-alpha-carbinolamine dehydratase n=1 Tax=Candidatus Kaiserbacteria bacterium RIFCSPHIGHO2_01_FULL_55_17 TaxID=1798484 RepID=A0A1F6D7X6_9BACT|nr:MAG: hypothetical protein A2853_03680 [Candidatus Kaiserbacteria bacterium RIFCSPHIGHO2_01_FULL_55_17]
MALAEKRCVPCEGGALPLLREEAEELLLELKGWKLSGDTKNISKELKFKNYQEAMDFANKITPIAESEGHHPDLSVGWGRVGVTLSTHAIGGLSENDFIVAAKIDGIA